METICSIDIFLKYVRHGIGFPNDETGRWWCTYVRAFLLTWIEQLGERLLFVQFYVEPLAVW